MSHRGKRPGRLEHQPQQQTPDGPPAIKRRKGRPSLSSIQAVRAATAFASTAQSASSSGGGSSGGGCGGGGGHGNSHHPLQLHQHHDEELSGSYGSSTAATSWQPKPNADIKNIYNRTASEAPAELIRKDLISAMKLPDSEPLASDEYWTITDQWKQEWERGVQVPVNPDSLPEPSVRLVTTSNIYQGRTDFKL